MSSRNYLAVDAAVNEQHDPIELCQALIHSVTECNQMNVNPLKDNAVLLLAAQLSFVFGTDKLYEKYPVLYEKCLGEIENDLAAVQSPENIN